jgi:hypothetical protein
MTQRQIADGFHISLTLGKGLFTELLGAALPVSIQKGPFNLVQNARDLARQLQVKEKVAGLLEGPDNEALVRVKDRAATVWGNRREQVYELVDRVIRIEGDWEVQLAKEGTDFKFGKQQIGAEAHVNLIARGTATLLDENIQVPFTIEHSVGEQEALVGVVQDVGVDLGQNILLRLANDIASKLIEEQALPQVNPVTVLPKAQLDEAIGGAATAIKLKMEVTDVELNIDDEYATFKVKFGFKQLQIEDQQAGK